MLVGCAVAMPVSYRRAQGRSRDMSLGVGAVRPRPLERSSPVRVDQSRGRRGHRTFFLGNVPAKAVTLGKRGGVKLLDR
jgi:hypothetical protein